MTRRISCFLLALTLIIITIPATATDSGTGDGQNPGTAESPILSVVLNNLNQVTGVVTMPAQSPTLSATLSNLNQVTGVVTSPGQSPTLSATLSNLNQVTAIEAGAAQSPTLSIALSNANQFTEIIAEYGVPLAGLFTIKDKLTEDARTEFDAIADYVNEGQAVAGYFGIDLPELVLKGDLSSSYLGFDSSTFILSEYVSLGINDYQGNNTDVAATFGFASEYKDGQTVVVMFGYHDENGNIVWNALNTVAINGQVKIDFPSELLLKAGSEAILGVLS